MPKVICPECDNHNVDLREDWTLGEHWPPVGKSYGTGPACRMSLKPVSTADVLCPYCAHKVWIEKEDGMGFKKGDISSHCMDPNLGEDDPCPKAGRNYEEVLRADQEKAAENKPGQKKDNAGLSPGYKWERTPFGEFPVES